MIQEVSGGGDFLGLRGSRQRDQHKQSLEEGGVWSGKENQQVLARGQREATAALKVRDVGQARLPSPARVWTQSAIKAKGFPIFFIYFFYSVIQERWYSGTWLLLWVFPRFAVIPSG